MKEQHELDLQEMSWHQRMWRWQNGYFNNSSGSSSDWYFGDEDEDEDEEDDYDEYNNGYYFNSFDAIHEVDIEEDEEEEQDDDDDDTIFMGRRLPNFEDPAVQEEEEEDKSEVTTTQSTSSPTSSVVVSPTFISPCDLPDYHSRLTATGVLLESVSIIGSSSNGSTLISGTVALALPSYSKSSSIPLPSVSVRYSTDGWANSTCSTAAATAFVAGSRYGFVVDASRLTVGDDLELAVDCEYNGQKWTDDNAGSNYRFICKNKPRFQPGKSLWVN